METINRLILTFLLNATWQVAAIALLTTACACLMRNAPARHRHMLFVLALMLSVTSPFLSLLNINVPRAALNFRWFLSEPPLRALLFGPTMTIGESETWRAASFQSQNPSTVSFAAEISHFVVTGYLLLLLYRASRLWRVWRKAKEIVRKAQKDCVLSGPLPLIIERCRARLQVKEVTIWRSGQVDGALTFGVRRPVIILAENLLQKASEDVLESALAHEMAHISRCDFIFNLVYELLFLPLAFHPAALFLKRQINRTRELACDEMVIERIVQPKTYARSLVKIADLIATRQGRPAHTLGVLDADILEERIMKIIKRNKRAPSRAGKFLVSVAAFALILTSVAATEFSFHVNSDAKQNNTAGAQEERIVGVWHGKWPQKLLNNQPQPVDLPAIDLIVNESAGKLSGTIVYYAVDIKHGSPQLIGKATTALIDPVFNGETLSFKTKTKRAGAEGTNQALEMNLLNDHKGDLKVIGSDPAYIFRMIKAQ
jgi:beta-lactamase regulating signal transducer with metallopeptidase domain